MTADKKKMKVWIVLMLLLLITGCSTGGNQGEAENETSGTEVCEDQTEDQTYTEQNEITEIDDREEAETSDDIRIEIDDNIALNDLFVQFIAGNIDAYSYGEEKSISDYYEEDLTREINVVHFMAEDLNGDGENELLININWTYADGIILAFHCQDGELSEWESIRYGMHSPEVTLYPDVNIVEVTGTRWTRSFFTYNSQGGKEQIFSCSSWEDNLEDGSFRRQYLITVYQDGIAKKEYSVEEIFDKNDNVVFVSSEEETLIFDGVLDDFLNMLGEGKEISSIQNDGEVTDTVTFNDLINGIVVQ